MFNLPAIRVDLKFTVQVPGRTWAHLTFLHLAANPPQRCHLTHAHEDGLAMQIYAYGHSLIGDFTCHKGRLRRYAKMTVAHQAVVIAQQSQRVSCTGDDVQMFAALMDGVPAMRVDNTRAYAGLATQYTKC